MPVALLHDLPWDNEQAKARFMSEAGEQAKLLGREIFSSVEEFLTVLEDDMPSKVDRFKLLVSFSTDVYVGETNLYGERVPTGGRSSASRFVQSSDTRDPIPIQLFDYLSMGRDLVGDGDHPYMSAAVAGASFVLLRHGFKKT